MLQGTPLLGSLFAMRNARAANAGALALLAAGSLLLTAHVFLLNDWAGMSGDLRDPNRRNLVFTRRGVTPRAAAAFSIALLLASLLVLSNLGLSTLAIAFALAGLSSCIPFPASTSKAFLC